MVKIAGKALKIVTINLSTLLIDKIDAIAGQLGYSRSEFMRNMIDDYLRKEMDFLAFLQAPLPPQPFLQAPTFQPIPRIRADGKPVLKLSELIK